MPVLLNGGAASYWLFSSPHRCHAIKNLLHLRDHVDPAPFASAKKDQAWSGRPFKDKQPRIGQIGGNHVRASCAARLGISVPAARSRPKAEA
jgi:hypothetical protein